MPKKLIVEIDGKYHETEGIKAIDKERTEALNNLGFYVLRFTNEDVWEKSEEMLETIKNALNNPPLKRAKDIAPIDLPLEYLIGNRSGLSCAAEFHI